MAEQENEAPKSWELMSRLDAEAMAAEIRMIHPRCDALVLYAFGSGGYGVVARSPLQGQEDVLLLNRMAYRIFQVLRADAWRREWSGRVAERTMSERVEESAQANMRLRDEQEGR